MLPIFSKKLKGMGLKINPYGHYVVNSIINKHQCMVLWYVDDIEILHTEEEVLLSIIKVVEDELIKLIITRGKKHTFWV